jgi:(E)-4-hydroxy-3-methylbut-2-enyl-diphosphate synthase
MWKTPLETVDEETVRQVEILSSFGCDILRFAVPEMYTADRLGELADRVKVPLVADIHFDYRIALRCLDRPIAKIRINPGNIGAAWKVQEVVRKAKDRGVAIRVGINAGSLPKSLRGETDSAKAMVLAAEEELSLLDRLDFDDVIFSLKASEIDATIRANTLFAEKYTNPLHLGLTEAGPLVSGIVKSTYAMTFLLREGIGDTIRISLSDSPESELIAGREILRLCGQRKSGIQIVSCPTCGRAVFDVKGFLERLYPFLMKQEKNLTVAIMGCPVNGPQEARHAQLGITGSGKYAVIFKEGKIVRRVPLKMAPELPFYSLS